ncbi:hypothetical protein FA95DRAFT_514975 [Auriscalpium vulgare]|uniref:Uncharacterized protein n=1 Tax=Auriscalpium vulgare TaxID=40419 RepID=A0ACB8RFQ7_9AGAM|nr:hypothetical protein FA95DRAFT_514975 [Auriscalpium vulgare]
MDILKDTVNAVLTAVPHMRTLLFDSNPLPVNALYRAPYLTYLSVGRAFMTDSTYTLFPSVRHAIVSSNTWNHFLFKYQGRQMKTIHVSLVEPGLEYAATPLRDIERSCPNLAHLILYLEHPPVPLLGPLPRLRYIGLHFAQPEVDLRKRPWALMQALMALDCSAPRVVRFLNADVAEHMRVYLERGEKMGTELLGRVTGGMLQLQDPTGRRIVPYSQATSNGPDIVKYVI